MRIDLRERFGDRPVRTVATASLLEDGTVEVVGEPASVDFLSLFRVLDPKTDTWVSKDEDHPALVRAHPRAHQDAVPLGRAG